MREYEASDIDFGGLGCNNRVWLRIHGFKKPVEQFGAFSNDEFSILIQSQLNDYQRKQLYENRSIDFHYAISLPSQSSIRYRAHAYFELNDIALNMRAINTGIRPYSSYGFHNHVTRVLNLQYSKQGLILITGITGSGKSTTLDAIVDLNNRSIDAHIIILAAPVEFIHSSNRTIIRHREVGSDTLSFKRGIVESLRQDPDIIIIGEMRDPETIMAALEAADSGHKVFSTLHTSSATESIDRIIAEVPVTDRERVRHRLADILQCVVSQKLLPGADGKLILAKEVLVMTPSVKAAIKNNNTGEIYQMICEGSEYGMITMEQDLKRLFHAGKISQETAINFANNKRRIEQLLHSDGVFSNFQNHVF
jgi:twitching motility protein PilT